MVDDKMKPEPGDPERVNMREPDDRAYWCAKWGVTEDQLRHAVDHVGMQAKDIARHLGKKS